MKRLSNWLIQLTIPDHLLEDIVGDMEEEYFSHLESKSTLKAQWLYFKDTISLLFSYTIKKRKNDYLTSPYSTTQNSLPMLKNYIKVAWRNLNSSPFFTFINIFGLAFGMSMTILYIGFISSLLRFDKFHENYDDIYRIVSHVDKKTSTYDLASTPPALSDVLNNNYADMAQTVKINELLSGDVDYKGKILPIKGFFVNPDFLDVFTFPMKEGNPLSALSNPYQVVLTEEAAVKFFGDYEAIGKVIKFKDLGDFEVVGVVSNPPKGSHLMFDALASYSTLDLLKLNGNLHKPKNEWLSFWGNFTYLKLDKTILANLQKNLDQISTNQYTNKDESRVSFSIQPLEDIVMGWTNYNDDIGPYFGGPQSIGFGIFTLLILLPACFNYSNISISRAMKRAKEIGIRKVAGGSNWQIWYQFVVETIIISLLALLGSIGIFVLIKDGFAELIPGGSSVNFDIKPTMLLIFTGFAILVGLFAGMLPATYLAKIKPLRAFSNKSLNIIGKTTSRQVLIVTQFCISLFFIIGVLVQFRQTHYSLNYDMGFDKENIVNIKLHGADLDLLRNEFSRHSSVQSVSMSSDLIGTNYLKRNWLNFTHKEDSLRIREITVDYNYLKNLDLKLVAGKGFNPNVANPEQLIIVNETFTKNAGFESPAAAVGSVYKQNRTELTIQGVVEDFNYELIRAPIRNLVVKNDPSEFQYANIKITTSDYFSVITELESIWKSIGQEHKMEATLFSNDLEESAKLSFQMLKLYGLMGSIAVIVSCLGLLGMVVYTTERRSKEVGIRKVVGATVSEVIYLLSKNYLKLIFIAAAIAIPLSYFAFNLLLSIDYHYSVTVGPIEIVIGLFFLLLLGGVTLITQTYRAARANPADTLRIE